MKEHHGSDFPWLRLQHEQKSQTYESALETGIDKVKLFGRAGCKRICYVAKGDLGKECECHEHFL